MSTTEMLNTPVLPEPIETTIAVIKTPRKRSKKKKKKKKKPYPINPVQIEPSDDSSDNHPQHKSRKSITDLNEILQHPKSARKPSKSPPRRRKKKGINKASSLIRVSPRFAAKASIIKAATPSKPLKRRKKNRTNSSTVYKFVEYDSYSDPEDNDSNVTVSDSDSNRSLSTSTTPILWQTGSMIKIPSLTLTRNTQSHRWRTRSARSRRARIRSSSVGKDDEELGDNALLKRLKTENKQLRKSRNMLRKDHGLLMKIERKLRHKLDIIVSKFKQITIDLVDIDDEMDWCKLQKKGDIEGILDAVFVKFGKITDEFVKSETIWKLENERLDKVKNGWREFAEERLGISTPGYDEDMKGQIGIDDMCDILHDKWDEIEQEMMCYTTKDEKQQSEIKELKDEILRICENEVLVLKQEKTQLEGFKDQYLTIKKQLEEEQKQFSQYKTKSDRELNGYKEEHANISAELEHKMNDMKLVAAYTRETETENLSLKNEMERIGKECEDTLRAKDNELSNMRAENKTLNERKEELMGLKMEHFAVTEKLNEVQSQIDGLQQEFRIVYKKKKKFETENTSLKQNLKELKRSQSLRGECGTQTEYAFISSSDNLKQLESENISLMNELNAVIAERSTFIQCTSDKDYHFGDIGSIIVSPINYMVITAGKDDKSLRIWEPKKRKAAAECDAFDDEYVSEITFVPKRKAMIDGMILTVNMSKDGVLIAAGASLKNTVHGCVVVWRMNGVHNGDVLCNFRSRSRLKFGKIYCVEFMKYDRDCDEKEETKNKNKSKSKRKKNKDCNYLLFAGDTTGCILCWNLLPDEMNGDYNNNPIAMINGHSDTIYDLSIVNNKWLFSVSNDHCLMHLNIDRLDYMNMTKKEERIDYLFSKRLLKDDSSYPLKSVVYNERSNELIFGSRKCHIFKLNTDDDEDDDDDTDDSTSDEDEDEDKYFVSKYGLNSKDSDPICNLKIRENLMIIQRTATNYVKIFNLKKNKLVKTYQIDDAKTNKNNTFTIYDCGISYDKQYAILCVGIFNKENLNNLQLNRSALKGFKIPNTASSK